MKWLGRLRERSWLRWWALAFPAPYAALLYIDFRVGVTFAVAWLATNVCWDLGHAHGYGKGYDDAMGHAAEELGKLVREEGPRLAQDLARAHVEHVARRN